MKTNLPVSGRAVEFSANANILSTTNPKGTITYVNPDFINISGFSESELLGVNHNIVRHPDLPPEAFAHMWQTLKDGRSWMADISQTTQKSVLASNQSRTTAAHVAKLAERLQLLSAQLWGRQRNG